VFSQVNGAQAFAREEKVFFTIFERMDSANPL
jgi:hypothetical protein